MQKRLIIAQASYSKPQATNAEQAQKAWADGKDFQVLSGDSPHHGRYLSKRDVQALKAEGYTVLSIRLRTGPSLGTIPL